MARLLTHRAVSDWAIYKQALSDKIAVEIGGPTIYFDDRGILPVYGILGAVDNCQFSTKTIWTGELPTTFNYHPRKPVGEQFIVDGTDLNGIPSETYDALLSSHCLEHIANPIKALVEWCRVLKPNGTMLMLLPHKEVTFDWRRPTTPLSHLVADFDNHITEDDRTHFEEILKFHDLTKTPEYPDAESFKQRCMQNDTYRAMHHHTFTTESAIQLLDYAGLQMIAVDAVKPAHIVLLARKSPTPDNSMFLSMKAKWRTRSAYRSDLVAGS